MKSQGYIYWTIISFILIVVATFFAFRYLFNLKNNIDSNNIMSINCNQLYQLYNESYYKVINEKVYLVQNCTIDGIIIPEGYRIIYIYEGNISYI
ncbi:hypothetical protein YN1_4450 [Nanoarchaeota archaeon]